MGLTVCRVTVPPAIRSRRSRLYAGERGEPVGGRTPLGRDHPRPRQDRGHPSPPAGDPSSTFPPPRPRPATTLGPRTPPWPPGPTKTASGKPGTAQSPCRAERPLAQSMRPAGQETEFQSSSLKTTSSAWSTADRLNVQRGWQQKAARPTPARIVDTAVRQSRRGDPACACLHGKGALGPARSCPDLSRPVLPSIKVDRARANDGPRPPARARSIPSAGHGRVGRRGQRRPGQADGGEPERHAGHRTQSRTARRPAYLAAPDASRAERPTFLLRSSRRCSLMKFWLCAGSRIPAQDVHRHAPMALRPGKGSISDPTDASGLRKHDRHPA